MNTGRWTSEIDAITEAFTREFEHLSSSQLNWKPVPGAWSIGQVLDHIITINSTYFPLIDSVKKGQHRPPFHSRFGFLVRLFGKEILKSVQPDRRKKIRTFPIWEPSSSEISEDILERFADHQEQLKKVVITSSELLDLGTVISSPANRNIVYTLETAFDIIVTHERRHFEQAMEVLGIQKEFKNDN